MAHAILTVDLGFGDAGKGSIVDYLARAHAAHTVVRYNGGAQAGHRVVTAETAPRSHVFSQFGSGTLAGARTHLTRWMLLEPLAMEAEAAHLRALGVADPFALVTVDARALVITPFQRAVNRLRELARGDARHGSCGIGVGETMRDAVAHGARVLRVGDLRDPDRLRARLRFLRALNREKLRDLALPDTEAVARERAPLEEAGWLDWLMDRYRTSAARLTVVPGTYLHDVLRQPGTVVFEAAQGVLLDEWRGFHPYTTWSTTTLANADRLLGEAGYMGRVTRLGITRAYATRHGAGPFVTEDAALTRTLPDAANGPHPWQQGFRVGWPDAVMLRYAREVVGPLDGLAVTCLDRLTDVPRLYLCARYTSDEGEVARLRPSPDPQDLAYQAGLTRHLARCRPLLDPVADVDALLAYLASATQTPVTLLSHGPTAADKTPLGVAARRG